MRIRSQMLNTFKMNFQSDKTFTDCMWKCKYGQMDAQTHATLNCPLYSDLRCDKDFDNDEDLVTFFRQVIERRHQEDMQWRTSMVTFIKQAQPKLKLSSIIDQNWIWLKLALCYHLCLLYCNNYRQALLTDMNLDRCLRIVEKYICQDLLFNSFVLWTDTS